MNLVKRKNGNGHHLAHHRGGMGDIFRRFFDDWDRGWDWSYPTLTAMQSGWMPSVDVSEQEDRIVVKADLPGVKTQDVEVSVRNGMLTISGEKKEETEEKSEGYYHSERMCGSFRRDVLLPSGIDEDKVEATCHDGVLTVTLPKMEQSKAKKIKVKE